MFDTINFRLRQDDLKSRADFIEDLPGYLSNVAYTETNTGEMWISGTLGNLNITANWYAVNIGKGSLCKWYLQDNLKVLSRGDTKSAVEALSDTIHLPVSRAQVTRLDFGCGLIVKRPVLEYLDRLGRLSRYDRLTQPNSVYYYQNTKQLVFYDKIAEERAHKGNIPELYLGRNVLRYEYRVISRLQKNLCKAEPVRASLLYNRAFYNSLLSLWRDSYSSINKVCDYNIDFSMINTKKELYRLGLLSFIDRMGGQAETLKQIANAGKDGKLTPKQVYDLKAAVMDACSIDGTIAMQSDCIKELDRLIVEAVEVFG